MSDPFAGGAESKAVEAARVVNRTLRELTIKSAKAEGIRDYYEVGVLGYGRTVSNAFGGTLATESLHLISTIGDTPLRLDQVTQKVPDGAGGLIEQQAAFPVWVDPVANGATPMCQALAAAHDVLSSWVANHPESFPPTVLNVTDGEANDGDPASSADTLKALNTNDGSVLMFNCHISSSRAAQSEYPSTNDGLSDQFAKQLFSMSSELPPAHLEIARGEGFSVSERSRGFVFNAGLEELINFIEIGTRIKAPNSELR